MSKEPRFSIEPVLMKGAGRAWLTVDVGDYIVPKHFHASTRIKGGTELHLDIEVDDGGTAACRGLTIRAGDESPLSSASLRSVSLRSLVARALTDAAETIRIPRKKKPPGGIDYPAEELPPEYYDSYRLPTTAERADFYEQHAAGARRPRRGTPITDDNLRQVATIYRAAVEAGDPPTQTVADSMHVARSTAARWVMEARKRKILAPAMRGRGGEREEKP